MKIGKFIYQNRWHKWQRETRTNRKYFKTLSRKWTSILCTTVPKKNIDGMECYYFKVLVDNLKQILNENCIKIVT